MSLTRTQKAALILIVASIFVGTTGTVWNIYGSFDALAAAENAGIGVVGTSIRNALIFSVGGMVGLIVGALLLIFGRVKTA
jgi:biopolymer transport protein ExbB/TolQ